MAKNTSIQLKAVFLLVAFSLNTAIGFACAMGVHVDFNDAHHKVEAKGEAVQRHAYRVIHHHETEDGCCHDNVVKFQNLDKNFNSNAKIVIEAPVFACLLNTSLGIEYFKFPGIVPQKQAIQFFYPPPGDIRISIQSFQI